MRSLFLILGTLAFVSVITDTRSSEMIHEFSNPSFSGNGYSTHVLSIEQLRYNRENQIKDDEKSADPELQREKKKILQSTNSLRTLKVVSMQIYQSS